MGVKDFLGIIRAPFIILAIVCVFLGVATAYRSGAEINLIHLILVFLGGMAAHISVNSLNEYYDFRCGLDFKTIKTPFSGGSGTLINKPHLARYALFIGAVSSIVVFLIGIYFVLLRGIPMFLVGLIGLIMVTLYPVIFVKNFVMSLIAPGLGFGTSMVLGTHIALGGSLGLREVLVSFVPFFLVNNLLLLNQFPDKEPDEGVGRENVVILLGRKKAALVYIFFNISAYLIIIFGIIWGEFNVLTAFGLLTIIFAIPASIKAIKYADDLKSLLPAQGMNVIVNIFTPLLIAIGLFL